MNTNPFQKLKQTNSKFLEHNSIFISPYQLKIPDGLLRDIYSRDGSLTYLYSKALNLFT
jgi:hypothetical protein